MTPVTCPTPLLDRFSTNPLISTGKRRLLVVFGTLGDFDTLEYARLLVEVLPKLRASDIELLAIGIGNEYSKERFLDFTDFPTESLEIDLDPMLHNHLKLYSGLQTPFSSLVNLIIMCTGIGSPGTLQEVVRGYTGDLNSQQRISSEEFIQLGPGFKFSGKLFARAGGEGFLRPFELATIRLENMFEVICNWDKYMPGNKYLTQRGGTFLIDYDNTLLYSFKAKGLLGFSETMQNPLEFLDPWI